MDGDICQIQRQPCLAPPGTAPETKMSQQWIKCLLFSEIVQCNVTNSILKVYIFGRPSWILYILCTSDCNSVIFGICLRWDQNFVILWFDMKLIPSWNSNAILKENPLKGLFQWIWNKENKKKITKLDMP